MVKDASIVVRIRPAGIDDAQQILVWENDTEHWLVSDTSKPLSLDEVKTFLNEANDIYDSGQMRFMIEVESNQCVGCVDLFGFDPKNRRVGLGILVDRAHRGNGYGTDAIKQALDYCREVLEVHSVFAEVLSTNQSSRFIFESCGFIESGVKRDWLWDGRKFIDQLFYQRFLAE